MRNTLAIPCDLGASLDWADRILARLLTPRGEPVPPGTHRASEGGFSRFGWPDAPLVFRLPLYSHDDEPLGSYVGQAVASTVYVVDGREVDVDRFLEAYDERSGYLDVEVVEAGIVNRIAISTGTLVDG